jgi:hypothetical protein
LKEEANSTPTDTTGSLRENMGVQPNAQNINTRLLLGSDDILTAEAFLTIIREYNSLNESPTNEACAYIINSIECRYKTKRAYQNDGRARKKIPNFSITANDLTPDYTPAECLALTNSAINAVQIQSNTKRKTVKVKFRANKMNQQTDNVMILNKINSKPDKTTPVQKGILTTTMEAQGDTGANCSATDTIDVIHNYVEFETPQEVGVFSDDKTGSTLQALGEGVIKIISDQGSIMNWTVLYTPNNSGTVLSPDNYHTTHNSKLFAFYHLGTNNRGKIGFLDHNQREVESIQMKRTDTGEWLTNQILVTSSIENKHIIRAVNQRSDRIRELLTERNDNIQSMEDRVVIDQQQNESWATGKGSHHFDAMREEAHPIFKDVKFKTMETEQQVYTQKMKELELWHQRMGHCLTRTLNETRKCVEGIPDLPTNNPFFKCPFCERGKMVKRAAVKLHLRIASSRDKPTIWI